MASIKASFDVGAAIIGTVENTIKNFCFQNDYELTMDRGRGFFSKPLFIEIKTPNDEDAYHVEAFLRRLVEIGSK